MKRLFLLMVMLCVVASGHSKRKIKIRDQFRHPKPPIEVYIGDQILEFVLSSDMGIVNILIEDNFGNIVFHSLTEGNKGIIPVELELNKGSYFILIDYWGQRATGEFFIQ